MGDREEWVRRYVFEGELVTGPNVMYFFSDFKMQHIQSVCMYVQGGQ